MLVNGRMEGVWSYEKKVARTLVTIEMFSPKKSAVTKKIEREAQRLGEFFGSPAEVTCVA